MANITDYTDSGSWDSSNGTGQSGGTDNQAAPASGGGSQAWQGGTSSTASQLFGDIGSAYSAFAEVGSYHASQENYKNAAALAQQNEAMAGASELIKASQTQRQIDMTLGATRAGIAGAGFQESGSALDILRSSQEQGALAEGVIRTNGQIQVNSYAAQVAADQSMAKAAGAAAQAAGIGGYLKVAAFVGDNVEAALKYSGGGGGGGG